MVKTEFLANYTVFVSLAHITSVKEGGFDIAFSCPMPVVVSRRMGTPFDRQSRVGITMFVREALFSVMLRLASTRTFCDELD